MDKFVCKILVVLFAVSIAPDLSYAGPKRPRKVPSVAHPKTVGPEIVSSIVPPSVVSKEVARSLKKNLAPIQGPLFSSMEDAILRSMLEPPVLSLTFTFRDGVPVSILPKQEILTYIDYAIPLAPLLTVHNKVHTLQLAVGNQENFFQYLANAYYFTHFSKFTPHVRRLHAKLSSLHDLELEKKYLARFEQLVVRKEQVALAFNKNADSAQIRIRYLKDIDSITAKNFDPDQLILSVEQRMSPSLRRGLFRHLRGDSKVRIKHQSYNVYNFRGPLEYLSNLYTFLVNENYLPSRMTLLIHNPSGSLFLYNFDKSAWVRMTTHEYGSAKHLHVHVEKILPFSFMVEDKVVPDRIVLNLSIPIATPKQLPEGIPPQQALRDLFFEQPVQQLKELPYVTVIEQE